MFQIEGIKLYICLSQVIYRSLNILAVNISINQNITGLVGKNDTHLTCSFIKDINQTFINVAIIARNKNGIFLQKEAVAIFPPDKVALLPPSGDYLSGRVTLTNITKVSTTATLRFDNLKCEDEKDYICTFNYVDKFAFPSMPDNISCVVIASIRTEKQDNSSADFSNNRHNISLSTNRNSKSSFYTLLTDTVTLTSLQSTEKFVPSFREGETVQFTCTGNIGKPPGRFVWQIIPQQEEPIVYSNETTMVVDQIPDICSYRGISNLTVQITADHFKAKVRCFEESQADVLGMFVETELLNVFYPVRHINITKQPNKAQYDQKTLTINLTCKGDGNPEPTYKWFRQENTRSILSSTNLYIIEDVVQNSSGVYICEVYNTIDDIEYNTNYSVTIYIVDELWSSTESESLKISAVHAVYVIPIICAVAIGALVVRKFNYNRPKRKKKEKNCCQKLMYYILSCCDSNVRSTSNNTVPLTEMKVTSDVKKENKNNCRSSVVDENLVATVDINPQLEPTADSIYSDPCDTIQLGHVQHDVSDKTDPDIYYTVSDPASTVSTEDLNGIED
ncbi:CADM3 [Mytilus coruscus]|uniref:CADM3 n=1 Tax=Mytilus coruscus TaxID=42192 RepID=A0A6J8DSJ0_MYTCO|nr:CADM3 [Mytilus coruscus]